MPNIVNVSVSQLVAPAPSTLQQTGNVLSQGATILAPGSSALLEQTSDLTPLLPNTNPITNAVYASGSVTLTLANAHELATGDTAEYVVTGMTPSGYNGTFICTSTGANTLTYPLPASPGTATAFGVITPEDVGELTSMVQTFFNQGAYRSCYVLELGIGNPVDGVNALQAYLTANPNTAYAFLVPRTWDGVQAFLNVLANYTAPTAKTYFHVTTTLQNYKLYTSLMKCVIATIEAPTYGVWSQQQFTAMTYSNGVVTATTPQPHGIVPGQWFQVQGVVPTGYNGWAQAMAGTQGTTLVYSLATNPGVVVTEGHLVASYSASAGVPATEFTAAGGFWKSISYNPSSTNKVSPYCYSFIYGVTPFPTFGNSALLATLKAAGVNVILTGAQGGITNTMIVPGTTMDGRKYNYWYATDWVQINGAIRLTAAIIDGSNTPLNPLYYNQRGINRLQTVLAGVFTDAVAFGMVLFGPIETAFNGSDLAAALDAGTYDGYTVVNAVPFIPYSQQNPNDYKAGIYNGLSGQFTPQNGFDNILVNFTVSDFVTSGSL